MARDYVAFGETFAFKITPTGLVSMPNAREAANEFGPDGRRRLKDPEAWARGDYWADIEVDVGIWRRDDGSLYCGSVEVRTVPGGPNVTEIRRQYSENNTLGPDVTGEITARIWRQIPIGTLIDLTIKGIRDAPEKDHEKYPGHFPAELIASWEEIAAGERIRKRPGPQSAMTSEMLASVVAPAYLNAGRKPVEAVREALARTGYSNGHVTVDQARKAISRARRTIPPLIPPVRKKAP